MIIGSRDASSAQARAQELAAAEAFDLSGASNVEAVARATIVVVTVPWGAQEATLAEIRPFVQGEVAVDTTVPLVPPRVMRVQLPPEGSAAVRAQQLLGEGARVVAAFHNVAAHKLAAAGEPDCDVLVFGDHKDSREAVIALASTIGMRGLHWRCIGELRRSRGAHFSADFSQQNLCRQ